MNRYGQAITWSTPAAPQIFTGVCTSYSYNDQLQRQLDDDMVGDNRALIQHSRKAAVSFEAKVTADSTNFLDLSTGGALTISGIASGIVLATSAVERWSLGQPKTASVAGTHYPDMVQANPALAGVDLSAFTPDQAALEIVLPGGSLIYGTFGLGHAAGVLHMLTITQELQVTEDDPSPVGTILGAASHGYLRTIQLEILSKAAAPAVGTKLALTGAPTHAADYQIESVDTKFEHKRGKMYSINAVWIPPLTVG